MKFSKEIMKGASDIIVLQILDSEGDFYGYKLVRRVAENSEDIFEFKEGTLYPLLYRLEVKKLVRSYIRQADNGKKRRYYQITDKGKKSLLSRKKEYEKFFEGMSQILSLKPIVY